MHFIEHLYEEAMQYYRTDSVIEFPDAVVPMSFPTERTFRRYYHTDVHIRNLLNGWDRLVAEHRMHLEVALVGSVAIIYHDVVYDPTRKDNEERSAELMRKDMTDRLTESKILWATEAILQTKHTDEESGVWEFNVIRDLDLRGLGGSEKEYRRNTWQIRHEFSMFSDEQFLFGRTQFLNSMLGKTNIFRTVQFEHLEKIARRNITNELQLIQTPDEWKKYFLNFGG